MKMFLDSARTEEIRSALEMWDIDGLTSNPKHVAQAEKPLGQVLEELAGLFEDSDKPVSVEVNPHLEHWEDIVEEGLKLARMSKNFVVKVGASENGFRAIRELAAQGVRVNATLIFSTTQAWHAARSGAAFVSPFLGWKETHGDEARSLIAEIAQMLRNGGYHTQILAAALRNSRQIADAAVAGAHCVTAGYSVYRESFQNPYSTMGHDIFGRAWDRIPNT